MPVGGTSEDENELPLLNPLTRERGKRKKPLMKAREKLIKGLIVPSPMMGEGEMR